MRERLAQVSDPMTLLVALIANAPVGLQIYLPSGQSLLVNQAFRDMFGAEPLPDYNLFTDPLLQGSPILDAARRAFGGELVTSEPFWYDTPKQPLALGTPRCCALACTWVPLTDGGGRVTHIALMYRDVTDELLAKKQLVAERDRLRETQAQLQGFLDNAPVGLFVMDLEGRNVVVNRDMARTFGVIAADACGKTARELFGDFGEASEQNERRVLQSGRPVQSDEPLPTESGVREFLITRFPIPGADGAISAIGGIAVDVSERRRAEEQLRQSEARFQQMFRALPMAALLSRLSDRRFVDVNDAWLRLTGYSRDETIGATGVELDLWQDVDLRADAYAELERRGQLRDFAARMRIKSGAIREVLLSVDRVAVGGEASLLLLAHDVTELRQLERELRHSQKMDAIGRLAGGVAHDFNNILTAMNGADALLLEGLRADDPLRHYAETIKRSIGRAATLTRQLLTFTRKQAVQPVIMDPNDAVRAVADMLQRMIGADIELVTQLDARGRVKADPGALEQIVLNLAVNARDAMPSGGRLLLRTADVEQVPGVPDGDWVLVAVADSGVGMDAATRARLFEPFFTTKEQGKGTGLGLSTVYGIVTQSGGHIVVDSAPNRGADFRVYLPRQAGVPHAAPPPHDTSLSHGHETILLAEDDEAVRDFVHFVLSRLGYRVLEARDGIDALAQARSFDGTIDLLLTDVVMPRMDGRELARQLGAARPGLKVIQMSGYPGDARVTPPPQRRVATLSKPFERHDLARCVRQVLDGER
ncbi:MAG: PAS domain S-box protein [Myxococcales bacterium]|nr:PAS domain S-box protein [Myxococcales bacterium]